MTFKKRALSQQEQEFAKQMAVTGDQGLSAQRAGYAQPASAGAKNMAKPDVRARVEKLMEDELLGEIVPLCLKRHKAILLDPKSAGPTLIKAIELGYKYGGQAREGGVLKELHEMTGAELQHEIIRLEAQQRAIALEAKQIEGVVIEAETAVVPEARPAWLE